MSKKITGIKAMQNEGYNLPKENEQKYQKKEFAWWSSAWFIIFLTVSMSVLDALVLYDILDQAMTQAEYMGKIVSFGIALVLNMIPLLVAKFVHQAMYKIKRGAAVWATIATLSFFTLFASTVGLRFAYQDNYGANDSSQMITELLLSDEMEGLDPLEETDDMDYKALAVVLLLSIEPLVTSIVNFCLAYISDDEVRAKVNHLKIYKRELCEEESDIRAYLATWEEPEVRRTQLQKLDDERMCASQEEIFARGKLLKAWARLYLAEYLRNPAGASYITSSLDETSRTENNIDSNASLSKMNEMKVA